MAAKKNYKNTVISGNHSISKLLVRESVLFRTLIRIQVCQRNLDVYLPLRDKD